MEERILQSLIGLYADELNHILIFDSGWKLLWSNRNAVSPVFPDCIGLERTSYAGGTYHVAESDPPLMCRLRCNAAEGYRICELMPASSVSGLQLDVQAVAGAVQSMNSACDALYDELERQDLYEPVGLLNILTGNCCRLYRMAYLQMELDRLQQGLVRQDCFCVQECLKKVWRESRDILRTCAEVELLLCEPLLYMTGDSDLFTVAVLAAIVQCYHDFEHYQKISLKLTEGDGQAQLTVRVERLPAELPPNATGMGTGEGRHDGEKALLDAFARINGASWMMAEQADAVMLMLRFPCSDENGDSTFLQSTRDTGQGIRYSKYEVLLSDIRYRPAYR